MNANPLRDSEARTALSSRGSGTSDGTHRTASDLAAEGLA
jgi:hypothetical protein